MNRRVSPGTMEERFFGRKVYVFPWAGKPRTNESRGSNHRLGHEAVRIIPHPAYRPEQQEWKDRVKEREQANP